MNIVPVGFRGNPVKHFVYQAATSGSSSYAAPASGYAYIPIGGWVSASAVGSFTYYNGTAGSSLFRILAPARGVSWFDFWESPGVVLPAKCPVLESSTDGVSLNDFHVFAIVVRSGAGQGGTEQ